MPEKIAHSMKKSKKVKWYITTIDPYRAAMHNRGIDPIVLESCEIIIRLKKDSR